MDEASLPYHEPSIIPILVHTSFLLLLNAVAAALDQVLYCGLLGQVLVGIAWGVPGAKLLADGVQVAVVQLGYLGLLLLVYEGGLNTSFPSLKANLALSSGVALTGIALPIALSYTLQPLLNASPLQAFSAGAALCSTSLGTTFTVLSSSGLGSSRLGVVLTSAAMMDDVVGLVMVQVISNLGGDSFSAVTIVRPILVSLAFAVSAPTVCLFVVKPVTIWLNRHREGSQSISLNAVLGKTPTAFAVHTALLITLITSATYAGTSNLFAAYIAGACISWWDSEVPHTMPTDDKLSGQAIYEHYYHQVVSKILQPFFFASVGFSIPITRMFRAAIVWRGIVYSALMAVGKMVCGLWLVRLPLGKERSSIHPPLILGLAMCARGEIGFLISGVAESKGIFSTLGASGTSGTSSDEPSDLFLVVTWAIVVCTIIGPLGVGLCVRRVKMLQGGKSKREGGGRDVLGAWG